MSAQLTRSPKGGENRRGERGRRDERSGQSFLLERKPGFFAALSTFYLLVLVFALFCRQFHWAGVDRLPAIVGGIIPLAVPWFGAVGAVTASLYGVFDHNVSGRRRTTSGSHEVPTHWDASYDYWHVLRPAVGAVLGTIAYLMFVGFINATQVTGTASSGSGIPQSAEATIPYLVIAFVVGFRESTFRQLLKRIIDVILGPGIPGVTPPAGVALAPASVSFPDTAVGSSSSPEVVHVSNSGTGMLIVHGGSDNPPGVSLDGDGKAAFGIAANTVSGAVIAPGTEDTLAVTFTPPEAKAYEATLTVQANAGARTITLKGTGINPDPANPDPANPDPANPDPPNPDPAK